MDHLTDEQAALLLAELDRIIENEGYPLSRRIRALREIRALLRLHPERPPAAAPQRQYEPPTKGRYRRRRWRTEPDPHVGKIAASQGVTDFLQFRER